MMGFCVEKPYFLAPRLAVFPDFGPNFGLPRRRFSLAYAEISNAK
jgi:hypothetical protein